MAPRYDTAYRTTCWIESLASGFEDDFPGLAGVDLYAVGVDVDDPIRATCVAAEYADAVYVGYDASNARAALRRMGADVRTGTSHGEPR